MKTLDYISAALDIEIPVSILHEITTMSLVACSLLDLPGGEYRRVKDLLEQIMEDIWPQEA